MPLWEDLKHKDKIKNEKRSLRSIIKEAEDGTGGRRPSKEVRRCGNCHPT